MRQEHQRLLSRLAALLVTVAISVAVSLSGFGAFLVQSEGTRRGAGYEEMPEGALIVPLGELGAGYEDLTPGSASDTLFLCVTTDPLTWNPAAASSTASTAFTHLMFDGLVGMHRVSGVLVPELASSWSIDGDVVTFFLREGIRWSDGVLFTADDVVFSIRDVHGVEEPTVEKIDDHTVVATYTTPVVSAMLDTFIVDIVPKHILEGDFQAGTLEDAWGLDVEADQLVGIGPYMLESYEPGERVIMRRNPYYYRFDANGIQLPYFEQLDVAVSRACLGKLIAGEIDAVSLGVLSVAQLEGVPSVEIIAGEAGYGTSFVTLNLDTADMDLRSLFRRVEFRQAMAHAINKQRIIDRMYGGFGYPQWSQVSIPSPFYAGRDFYGGPITESSAVTYSYNLDNASALLDECGIAEIGDDGIREFESGARVAFSIKTNEGPRAAIASIIVEDLQSLGLDVHLEVITMADVNGAIGSGDWQAFILGLSGGDDPSAGRNVLNPTGALHFWHYSAAAGDAFPYEEAIEQLLEKGHTAATTEEAFDYYRDYQILQATEDLGMIFIVQPLFTYAVREDIGNRAIISTKAVAITVPELLYRIADDGQ